MNTLPLETAPTIAIVCAGLFFLTGLLTGAWKYSCMMNSDKFEAPYYVDIAHRAALLYSFAAILIAVFAYLSVFSAVVNTIATTAPLLFFAIAIVNYIKLGVANETRNQLRDSANPAGDKWIMRALMTAEIGGFSVLFAGFLLRLF